ncbi:unnamed protein product, partial [Didymodactylos carnosus]
SDWWYPKTLNEYRRRRDAARVHNKTITIANENLNPFPYIELVHQQFQLLSSKTM